MFSAHPTPQFLEEHCESEDAIHFLFLIAPVSLRNEPMHGLVRATSISHLFVTLLLEGEMNGNCF